MKVPIISAAYTRKDSKGAEGKLALQQMLEETFEPWYANTKVGLASSLHNIAGQRGSAYNSIQETTRLAPTRNRPVFPF